MRITAQRLGDEIRHPRRRFAIGRLKVAAGVVAVLTAEFGGDEHAARFKLGELLAARHLVADHGDHLSPADQKLNQWVLNEHVLRGTGHCVLSSYRVGSLIIDISTCLGERKTFIRLGKAKASSKTEACS